ncbi:MAG TPA: thiamine-phosphate kinase [Alphaproteobacteria bacterium]|nr:thiamine-phosphate kinase [Alphaproteobacteria bacterium]
MGTDPPRLGEFGRIERFFRPLAAALPGAFGLTDDAAVLTVPAGQDLVVTTDAIVEGVHFLPGDPPADIARKALRVNLSDLAAKGALPLAYTLTLAIGRTIGDSWVESFAAALGEDQARYGIVLAGGDSVSTEGPIWVSVGAFGLVPAGRLVRRRGARPGDGIFVTGTIGDAALGLRLIRGALSSDRAGRKLLERRYRLPEPRLGLASSVAEHAHAAMDISDGLAADLDHICALSGLTGRVELERVPLSEPARTLVDAEPALWQAVLGGGDDYELLLAVPANAQQALESAARTAAIPLTRIGQMLAGDGRSLMIAPDGTEMALATAGWTHA